MDWAVDFLSLDCKYDSAHRFMCKRCFQPVFAESAIALEIMKARHSCPHSNLSIVAQSSAGSISDGYKQHGINSHIVDVIKSVHWKRKWAELRRN